MTHPIDERHPNSTTTGVARRYDRSRMPVSLAAVVLLSVCGCDRLDMYDQPRFESYEASPFFGDGLSARPPVVGTIPRGGLRENTALFTGRERDAFVVAIPEEAYRLLHRRFPLRFPHSYEETPVEDRRLGLLERGRERFNIHCAVCHGRTGDGDGMIVQRGFRRPPSYQEDRLQEAAAGHLFDVMTRGLGAMASYASRVEVVDRWAIVAYIRVLQLSQSVRVDELPASLKAVFDELPWEDHVPAPELEATP